jgi:radical SAM protein (TIGR01212 family)
MKNNHYSKAYLTFGHYLKRQYGGRVRKISIHSQVSCPNRDGTKGETGCIYCNNRAFAPHFTNSPVHDQISSQIEKLKRGNIQKFIAYFQTYTNTYAPLIQLKSMYDSVLAFPEIVALSIGTRPDCVNTEILDLIESYANQYDIWIEYGLQSIHNTSLQRINRAHTAEDFYQAVELTAARKIRICVHVILGLPGESHRHIMQTARKLASLPIQGIKFHPLQIIRQTPLAQWYREGKVEPLDLETYVSWVVDFMEILPPDVVIQRLTADACEGWLIAPLWCQDKGHILQTIDLEFSKRNTYQGAKIIANP